MSGNSFVGAVTEYAGASLGRVQRGSRPTSGPAHTGTGGRT
jgi:hypothetical protein